MTETLYRFIIDTPAGRHDFQAARHPSESMPYLLCRVLAYALHFQPGLAFSRGVCVGEEPAILSPKGPSGTVPLWIDIGLPSEKKLRRAVREAEQVILYTDRRSKRLDQLLTRFNKPHLTAYCLDRAFLAEVAATGLFPTNHWHLEWSRDRLSLNGQPTTRTRLFPTLGHAVTDN